MTDYMKMKKDELAALARQAGIEVRGRMTKAQLAEALAELARAVEPPVLQAPSSPGTAWETGPPPPARPETPDLPLILGENRLCLMPQGPRTAFAYWEFDRGGAEGLLVIEFRSVPDGTVVARFPIGEGRGSWYLNLERSGMEVEAVMGVEGGEGFTELLRSNRIQLPWDFPSDVLDTLWMTRRRDFEEIFRLSGGLLRPYGESGVPYGERPGVPVSSWPTGRGKA